MKSVLSPLKIRSLVVKIINIRFFYTQRIDELCKSAGFSPASASIQAGYHIQLVKAAFWRGCLKNNKLLVPVTRMRWKVHVRKFSIRDQGLKVSPQVSIRTDRVIDTQRWSTYSRSFDTKRFGSKEKKAAVFFIKYLGGNTDSLAASISKGCQLPNLFSWTLQFIQLESEAGRCSSYHYPAIPINGQ